MFFRINKAFFVKAIAVLTKNTCNSSIYDVYEYQYYATTDEEVKRHIKIIIETALKNETKK